MAPISLFAPAKLNLFLAITGRRADGFHNLVSIVTPIRFGDTLTAELVEKQPGEEPFMLTCTDAEVPCDGTNLVLKAAHAFAHETGWHGCVRFHLEKRIPMGAGLGGGSSDGVAALRALNTFAGQPLDLKQLVALASSLGSDCPLFVHEVPLVMRGRGERVEPLPPEAGRRLSGRRVLVFKPPFGIPTVWAYRQLAEEAAGQAGRTEVYLPSSQAEQRLRDWTSDTAAPVDSILYNNLERPAFAKYLAIPTLLDQLRARFGLAPRMTGSGSACFTFLHDDSPVRDISAAVRGAWGDSAFVVDTELA